jgi:hypothetical protein
MQNLDKLIPIHFQREKIYSKFYNLFKSCLKIEDYDDDFVKKMSINIERGIFNYTLTVSKGISETWNNNFQSIYVNRAVMIYNNLNPNGTIENTNLLNRLLSKEFNEFELCLMTPELLFPERNSELMKTYCNNQMDSD